MFQVNYLCAFALIWCCCAWSFFVLCLTFYRFFCNFVWDLRCDVWLCLFSYFFILSEVLEWLLLENNITYFPFKFAFQEMLAIAVFIGHFVLLSSASRYSFITLGDWGGAQISTQIYDNVYAVSQQMASTASANEVKFIINTGDNFYWCGIQ